MSSNGKGVRSIQPTSSSTTTSSSGFVRSRPIAVSGGHNRRSTAVENDRFENNDDDDAEISFSMMVEGSRNDGGGSKRNERPAWQAAAASSVAAGRRAIVGSPIGYYSSSEQSIRAPLEMLCSSSVEDIAGSRPIQSLRRPSTSPNGTVSSSLRTSGRSQAANALPKVQPRKVSVWVPDEAAQRCYACGAEFTTYLRRHHCRACGNCFCYECCRRSTVLPRDIVCYPAPSHRAFDEKDGTTTGAKKTDDVNNDEHLQSPRPESLIPHYIQTSSSSTSSDRGGSIGGRAAAAAAQPMERVCERCFESLTRDMAVWPVVRLFDIWALDVVELRRVSRVSRLWHAAAVRSLSAFREIQYRMPTERLTEREQRQLQINAHLIRGHGLWTFHLLRCASSANRKTLDALGIALPSALPAAKSNVGGDSPASMNRAALVRSGGGSMSLSAILATTTQRAVLLLDKRDRCRKTVMCSRYCSERMRSTEALHLLRLPHIVRNDALYQHAVRWCIDHADDALLIVMMPSLSYAVRFQPPNCSDALTAALVPRCSQTRPLAVTLYWCLTLWRDLAIVMQQYGDCERYARALQHLNRSTEDVALLAQGEKVVCALMKQRAIDNLRSCSTATTSSLNFLLPTHPQYEFASLDNSRGGTVMQPSASQPIARRFIVAQRWQTADGERDNDDECDDLLFDDDDSLNAQLSYISPKIVQSPNSSTIIGSSNGIGSARVLFKRDDVRRDMVVMSVIRYAARVLAAEVTDFSVDDIVSYNVVPTSERSGVIEMVERATTLYDIRHRHQSTLFRFLVERNQNEPVAALRARFIRSAAAYSVITYMISAGDRHLENVMVTDTGLLFHIDYGYIFGEDPKPMAAPAIRLPPEMIDAIGGEGTESYVQFTELCSVIYNCLRRHVGPISTLLALLVDMQIVSSEKLREHVLSRFMPGECGIEATINLSSTISKSQHTYKQTFLDLSHRSARTTSAFFDNPLGVLSSLWGGGSGSGVGK